MQHTSKKVAYSFGKNLQRDATIKAMDEIKLIPILVAELKEQQRQIANRHNRAKKASN